MKSQKVLTTSRIKSSFAAAPNGEAGETETAVFWPPCRHRDQRSSRRHTGISRFVDSVVPPLESWPDPRDHRRCWDRKPPFEGLAPSLCRAGMN